MSFFGNESVAGTQSTIHHFRVNASQYGSIIPVVYGRARVPGLFIWTGDFVAKKSKGPGKGLGGSAGSFYTYSVAVEIALSQGPISSLGRSWHMGSGGLKRHSAAQTNSNWTLFPGAFAQAPWSYMTSKHPGQDLGYTGIAYLARSAWNLGTSGSPPQITFEVFGRLPYGAGVSDANPKDIIADILTDAHYGLGLSSAFIADLTDFSNYCVASGFFISPVFDQQKTMIDWLKMLLDCVHADAVWSNGQLKIVPYGDAPIVGNGITWVPSVGPVYVLDDNDFMAEENSAPVSVTVTTPSDRANVVNVEYINAANDYNIETVEAKDEADIQRLGQRRDSPKQFHPITNALMARSIAQLKLQRSLYVANQYTIRLPQRYILAEPMDVIGLTDPYLGLDAYPARIVEVSEEADDAGDVKGDSLAITLEDLGANNTPGYPTQPPGPWGAVDQNTPPNPINTNPIIFEPPAKALGNHPASAHLKGALELWVAASGQDADADWGGCNVYLSSDDSTYSLIGRIRNAAAMGPLLSTLPSHPDPDSVDTLQVDLSQSGGSLTAASHALADAGMNLAYIDGELICFADVSAGAGPNQFNLGYLRRGRYGTAVVSHSTGSNFALLGALHALDASILRIPLTNAHIGQTLYLKFASVNTEVDAEQDLAGCAAYPITIIGAGHKNRIPHRHVKKYQTGKAYSSGAYAKPNSPNGFFYQAQNAGTSGGSEPTWPLGIDESVTDGGGITWAAIEASPEIDDGSISTSGLDDTPLPDPAGLAWAITKKGDLKLNWSFVSPRPSNFSHFEVRKGASWPSGTTVDTTKRTQLLITDPPPGTTTYWVGAINVALVADAAPVGVDATMPIVASVAGLSASITRKGDIKLAWTPPSPMPAHFSNYEIRTSAAPGTGVIGRTKQHSFLITDPAPGNVTYWVGVLDRSGNYDISAPSVLASPASPGSVTGLAATRTRKKDLKLSWTPPSPFPPHFKSYEIRIGVNWLAGAFVAHCKQNQYVIHDAYDIYGTGSVTFWIGVLDHAGNYDAAPLSISGSMDAGFSLDVIADGDGSGGGTYAKTRRTALRDGLPAKDILQLFPSAVLDSDGVSIVPPNATGILPDGCASANAYSENIEIDVTFSLSSGSALRFYVDNGSSCGYEFVLSNTSGTLIVRYASNAETVLGSYPSLSPSVHHAVLRLHNNGTIAVLVDGKKAGSVIDKSYSPNGPVYFAQSYASVAISKLNVKGHSIVPDTAKDGNNLPRKSPLHLFPGLTLDDDGVRCYVIPGAGALASAASWTADIEIQTTVELSANTTLHFTLTDGANHGYDFVISNVNHCLIVRMPDVAGGAGQVVLADYGNASSGIHNAILRRHRNGKLTLILDGATLGTVKDTNYAINGPIAMSANNGGIPYISKLSISGHSAIPADNQNSNAEITQAGLDSSPLPDPTGMSAAITKKGDVNLGWAFASPRPSNFSHFEIRSGSSWAAGTLVDTTRKLSYLIVDPAPGTTTYWVAAINLGGVGSGNPPFAAAVPAAPADITALTATITKKGDVQLKWTKPAPFPAHFNCYEIRMGGSWSGGTFIAHTKQTQFLITDPAPGNITYWVGVLDLAGNYSVMPISANATPSAPASVTGLNAAVTKKQDIRLSWSRPSPFPPHFNAYEIRSGGSWPGGTFVAHTKQLQFVITDPPPGAVTYWVGVLDLAGNYDISQPSVSGSVNSGFSLGTITGTLDDISDGASYARVKGSAVSAGVPNTDAMHLFPSATLAADGKRIDVPMGTSSLPTGCASAFSYSENIEIDAVIELSSGAALRFWIDDGSSRGYEIVISTAAGTFVARYASNAETVIGGSWGNTSAGLHQVLVRYHKNGHIALLVDGKKMGSVVDTTYTPDGPVYFSASFANAYISKINIRGHSTIPVEYQDSDQRALIDLSQSGHSGKHLGNVADDAGPSKRKAHVVDALASRPAATGSGALFHAIDAGNNGTTFRDQAAGVWKKIATGHLGDADGTLDDVNDGAVYGSLPLAKMFGAGAAKRARIDFSDAHDGKHLGNVPNDSTTHRGAVHTGAVDPNGVPNRETLHLFPAASLDTDGKRIALSSTIVASAASYQADIEINALIELSPNSVMRFFITNNGSPTGNGYGFVISNSAGCFIERVAGGFPGGTETVLGLYGNTTTGVHQVTLRRHSNRKMTFTLDGMTLGTVKDTTYTPSSPIYFFQNIGGGQCWISKIELSGNPAVSADTIDPSSGALTAGALAAGAVTTTGGNVWSSAGISLSPFASTFSSWQSTVSAAVSVLNNGDAVEGFATLVFVAGIANYRSTGGQLSFLEVQIVNDLGVTVLSNPYLVVGDFTRDSNTTPSSYSYLIQAALGQISFVESTAGNRSYTLQARYYFGGEAGSQTCTLYRAQLGLRSYAA